jgi:hypothetical protein
MSHTKDVFCEHSQHEYAVHIWQKELCKVAFSCDFVLHALLAFTALHKAHVEPDNALMLRTSAVDHADKAMVLYRQETAMGITENANEKFVFAWLVALFAYAIPPSGPPIETIASLFSIVKGIDAVLVESWYAVAGGPFAALLTRGFQEAPFHDING